MVLLLEKVHLPHDSTTYCRDKEIEIDVEITQVAVKESLIQYNDLISLRCVGRKLFVRQHATNINTSSVYSL